MRSFLSVLAAAAFAAMASGCGGMAVLNENATSARLVKGESFRIELEGNRTTGYVWDVVSDGSPILALRKSQYLQKPADSGVVGAGGTECFEFCAVQRGKTLVELTYKRPWEKKGVDTRRFYLDVE